MIPEMIIVKDRAPVRVDVRVTRHGPLISDALNAINAAQKSGPKPPPIEPLAFRWMALDAGDSTAVVVSEAERGAQLGRSSPRRCATS